jgi:hypothetical protein
MATRFFASSIEFKHRKIKRSSYLLFLNISGQCSGEELKLVYTFFVIVILGLLVLPDLIAVS